jgi:DEAD/DEAH box helicase domain-containing protein
VIGQTALNLPPQTIRTQATWVQPPADVLDAVRSAGHVPTEGLVGIRNTMLAVLPLLAMCDRQDLSGVMDSAHHAPPAMFVYDRFPGGVGYARAAFDRLENLLAMCRLLVRECPCEAGCPSCVGLANLRPPLHQDPDLSRGYAIPDKRAALMLLDAWVSGDGTSAF